MKLSSIWTYETIIYHNICNYHLPWHMKLLPTVTYETIAYLNIWNYHLSERMKLSPTWTYETITYLNIRKTITYLNIGTQMWESLYKILTSVSTFINHVTTQGGHLYNSSVQHVNQTTTVSSPSFIKVCAPSSNNVFWKTNITSLHFSQFTIHNIQHPT